MEKTVRHSVFDEIELNKDETLKLRQDILSCLYKNYPCGLEYRVDANDSDDADLDTVKYKLPNSEYLIGIKFTDTKKAPSLAQILEAEASKRKVEVPIP